jgi:hypothetical protein
MRRHKADLSLLPNIRTGPSARLALGVARDARRAIFGLVTKTRDRQIIALRANLTVSELGASHSWKDTNLRVTPHRGAAWGRARHRRGASQQ